MYNQFYSPYNERRQSSFLANDPDFYKVIAIWKVFMLRPFVFLDEDVYVSLVNDSKRGKPKFLESNLSQCHFFHYASHMDWPHIVARISW